MMRQLANVLVALGLVAVTAPGCNGTIGESEVPDESESTNDKTRQEIDVARMAIFEGLDVGRPAIVSAVNRVLSENLLGVSFSQGSVLETPAPPAAASCPYLEVEAGDVALNCRFIVERARDLAYADMGPALDAGPAAVVLQAEQDQEWVQMWYQRGAFSGVDGEVVRAVVELRHLGACDTAPTPAENSELAGFELGRALYIQLLEARIAVTPPTVCDFDTGIIEPALAAAVAQVEQTIADQPLCATFAPTDATELFEFDRAKLAYELGIRAGIRDQAVISAQQLLTTWICTPPPPPDDGGGGGGDGGGAGDPLVVDLANDGIAPITLASNVSFDLTGGGIAARTAWPAAQDALLAIDLDGSGMIETGRELFSNYMVGPGSARFGTGFEALAAYDRKALGGDDNGIIDENDEVYSKLLVWTDDNQNGVSEASELTTLTAVGIGSLSITPDDLGRVRNGDAWMTEKAGALTEVWMDLRY